MDPSEKHRNDEPQSSGNSNLSTSGVRIMASMDASAPDRPVTGYSPAEDYERAGYNRCRFVEGFKETAAGAVPVVKTSLDKKDRLSTVLVRLGVNRFRYTIPPGLYGAGNPGRNSEVLVTANFKLTFDKLRASLDGINAWILVLDTKGINVWCAAGKGTFSTRELVTRIKQNMLDMVVGHKRIIVPQLGATGICAGEVKKASGFRVIYGPVRSADIPAFLENNRKADKKMREVTFTLYERFVLTPVEIQMAVKPAAITAAILFVLSGIGPGFFSFSAALSRGGASILAMVFGLISGAFLTPLLLPFIPSRKFAFKGIVTGIFCALLLTVVAPSVGTTAAYVALFLFTVTVSSYLAMNFTGATPFTSPSGVEKEMKQYIPVQFAGLAVSTGLWIYSAF